jgi:UDP-3-O-[3-hydroxymyristoyl] glucosamine N-acyltransferase
MASTGGRYTLGQLAQALGAVLEGDAQRVITGVASLDRAGPDQISFVTNRKYLPLAKSSRAGALLVPADIEGLGGPLLRTRSPQTALISLLKLFHPALPLSPGVHPSALVAPESRVHPEAFVGAFAVIQPRAVVGARARIFPLVYVGEGAEVGEESTLYPQVVIRDGVRIGRRVIVHAGAVLGADGFGYVFDGSVHQKIPQVGGLVIEDDVEIGANTTIDRATFGDTVVRRGTKIDNLVQIAHTVEIGEHSILAAQVGIAGSSRVGRGVVLGGQAGVADHVTIGDGAVLGAQTGVTQDVAAGEKLFGTWGRPMTQARRIWLAEAELPELVRRLRAIERRLERLEARLEKAGETDSDAGA